MSKETKQIIDKVIYLLDNFPDEWVVDHYVFEHHKSGTYIWTSNGMFAYRVYYSPNEYYIPNGKIILGDKYSMLFHPIWKWRLKFALNRYKKSTKNDNILKYLEGN